MLTPAMSEMTPKQNPLSYSDRITRFLSKENVLAIAVGVILATVTFGIGGSLANLSKASLPTTSGEWFGLLGLSLLLSLVAGYYFGVTLKKKNSTALILFTYFLISLIVLIFVFRSKSYFYYPPLLTLAIGIMILNGNIDLDARSGITLAIITKVSMSIISGAVNSVIIDPITAQYVGWLSGFTWVWVVIVAVYLIWTQVSKSMDLIDAGEVPASSHGRW